MVPGVLQIYDLPDLAARLAPRRLSIHGAVDAMGDPVSADRARRGLRGMHPGVRAGWPTGASRGSRLDPEPLTEADELIVEHAAAQVGVEDRRRVDELGGLFELAGVEIGQGQRVPRVEPGE